MIKNFIMKPVPIIPAIISIVLLLSTTPSCFAQETFSKYLGRDWSGSIGLEPNHLILCHTIRFGLWENIDGFVYHKLDYNGNYVESREFSTYNTLGFGMQHGRFARSLSSGGQCFLFGNNETIGNVLRRSVRMFRTNSVGDIIWNRRIKFSDYDHEIDYLFPNNFSISVMGGYYIYATHEEMDGTTVIGRSPMIMKIDDDGNLTWSRILSVPTACGWRGSSSEVENGDIMMGFSTSPNCTLYQQTPYVCRMDSVGTVIWSKKIDGCTATLTGYVKLVDGHLFLGSSPAGLLCFLVDDQGNVSWAKILSFDGWNIVQTPLVTGTSDGGYAALMWVAQGQSSDLLLLKMNATHEIVWADHFAVDGTSQSPIHIIKPLIVHC